MAREWVVFTDPADDEHEIRADLTWLLTPWRCIFANGCRGIVAERPDDGCCTHGAFFTGPADESRVRAAARRLTPEQWQWHGSRVLAVTAQLDGAPARRTRTVDGGCVFLNRPGFPAGAGCALHAAAQQAGQHPLTTKPDVCWQLPLSVQRRPGVTVVGEFSRAGWGAGGAELHWWCTGSAAAHSAPTALVHSYASELTELLGAAAYARLLELAAQRLAGAPPRRPAEEP